MWIFIPALCFVLILLSFYRGSRCNLTCWRSSFLSAAVVWGVLVVAATELLSIFQLLAFGYILGFWVLMTIIAAFIFMRIPKQAGSKISLDLRELLTFSQLSRSEVFLLLSAVIILAIIAFLAAMKPPNTWDSMVYHLSRVAHWIQNRTVAHYPTSILKQLFLTPFPEFVIMHFQVLSHGDRFAGFVQWFSMLGSILGITLIAKRFGSGKRGQILSAIVAVTLPMGILQGSGTQTDHVVGFFMVCLAYFVLLFAQGRKSWSIILKIGMSLGLAILAKGTAYFYALPFCIWFFIYGIKYFRLKIWKHVVVIVAIVLCINGGYYMRNYNLFGTPLSDGGESHYVNEVKTVPVLITNVLKNISLHMVTPSRRINKNIETGIRRLNSFIGGADPDDLRVSLHRFTPSNILIDADIDGNPSHAVLILISFIYLLFQKDFRKDRNMQVYMVSIIFAFFVFCLFIKWQPFGSRLHLPLFLLFSPLCGIALSRIPRKAVANVIAFILIFCSIPWILRNNTCPLVGHRNIFETSRIEEYFNKHPGLEYSYRTSVRETLSQGCLQQGLVLEWNSWEYPLWILFKEANKKGIRIEHVNVKNVSSKCRYPLGKFTPCAVVSDYMRDNQKPKIIVEDNTFMKTRQLSFLSPFLLDRDGKLERRAIIYKFNRMLEYMGISHMILNEIKKSNAGGQITFESMNKVREFRRKVLEEFEYIDTEELNKIYEGLGTHFIEDFIGGLKLNTQGFDARDTQMIRDGERLLFKWNAWMVNNKEALEKAFEN